MDNHPIPQDITGFEFKLIGNMTVKQFAYLAGGLIPGWLFFISPIPILIKIPISSFFIAMGLGLSFIPIEGRPMDIMISNFIKALFKPTQFIYQKRSSLSVNFTAPTITQNQPNNVLPAPAPTLQDLANKQADLAPALELALLPKEETPIIDKDEKDEELVHEKDSLEKQLLELRQEEQKEVGTPAYNEMHQKVLSVENLLNQTLLEKERLEREILELQKKLGGEGKKVYSPSQIPNTAEETKNVRIITQELGKKIGVPSAPEFPNIVTGIIKDPRGNPLSNILVEIKDLQENPVRAFKTNPLGQFASATPLANGTYKIEFEDPKSENKFDAVQFTTAGDIILPIEVISVDEREKLRKSLFIS